MYLQQLNTGGRAAKELRKRQEAFGQLGIANRLLALNAGGERYLADIDSHEMEDMWKRVRSIVRAEGVQFDHYKGELVHNKRKFHEALSRFATHASDAVRALHDALVAPETRQYRQWEEAFAGLLRATTDQEQKRETVDTPEAREDADARIKAWWDAKRAIFGRFMTNRPLVKRMVFTLVPSNEENNKRDFAFFPHVDGGKLLYRCLCEIEKRVAEIGARTPEGTMPVIVLTGHGFTAEGTPSSTVLSVGTPSKGECKGCAARNSDGRYTTPDQKKEFFYLMEAVQLLDKLERHSFLLSLCCRDPIKVSRPALFRSYSTKWTSLAFGSSDGKAYLEGEKRGADPTRTESLEALVLPTVEETVRKLDGLELIPGKVDEGDEKKRLFHRSPMRVAPKPPVNLVATKGSYTFLN